MLYEVITVSADAALCLWAYHDRECIVDDKHIPAVVERIMQPDMLNPDAGVRNYSRDIYGGKLLAGGYHRSPNTYWPFVSGLIAAGLDHFGYTHEATKVAESLLRCVDHFDGCIEMFLGTGKNSYVPWQHPTSYNFV